MTGKHTVILQPSGRRGQVEEGKSVREVARRIGRRDRIHLRRKCHVR